MAESLGCYPAAALPTGFALASLDGLRQRPRSIARATDRAPETSGSTRSALHLMGDEHGFNYPPINASRSDGTGPSSQLGTEAVALYLNRRL